MRGLKTAIVLLFGISAAAAADPSTRPRLLRAPNDSLLVRIAGAEQSVSLAGVSSPDTTFLGVDADLTLITSLDTVVVPCAERVATLFCVRSADTLTEVIRFGDQNFEQLRRRRALLHAYARYAADPDAAPLRFEPMWNDSVLSALSRAFPLDSIAGDGDDLSRMRRLRHWVHAHVRYDGNHANPDAPTLVGRLKACTDGGESMNCGGMSSVYTAACLSVGLPARRIVCHSFDRKDPDCHSVSVVWSGSLDRWVYMDPSFDAEWSDERGEPLGLQDARDRLAAGDTVIVDPGANFNGTPRSALEHLAYMSKNLFRFMAWVDPETVLYLEPCGYDTTRVEGETPTFDDGLRRVTTTDLATFWVRPAGAD